MTAGFSKVLIIGMGLIGGSLAGALKTRDPQIRVYGIDPDAAALRAARERGLIEEEDAPAYADIDLVVLAAPVEAFESWFRALSEGGYAGAVTDVASAKTPVVRAAKKALADPGRFIPGHPMAGREKNGVDSARSDLFDGAAWILAPDSSVDLDVQIYQRIHTLIAAIGARVVVVDAAEHDKLMAILSHVPHVAASSLVMLAASHRGENGELLRFAGGGFKDTTRVAAGDPALWAGILQSNAELIADELKELTDILSGFERSIRSGDTEETRRMLAAAAEARKSIPAKWVPESAELIEVHVQMDNRPGAVAQITAEAGRRACNIQAIDIDHQTESYAILRLVLTDEGDIAGFVSALGEYGFEAEIYLPPTAPYAFPW